MDVNGIAKMSMNISQYNAKEAIGISVLKMALDNAAVTGQELVEMANTANLSVTEGIDIKI